MCRRSLSILVAILATAAVTVPNLFAQPSAPSEPSPAATLASIKEAIVKATGAEGGTVELSANARAFAVKVVNGKLADGTSAGRENEAGAIESIVVNSINGKSQFKGIVTIVVEYVKRRSGGRSHVVDSIEFRKDATGAFRHHTT
jgi:hypothetical protein